MRIPVIVVCALTIVAVACGPSPAPVDGLDQRTAVALAPAQFEAVHAEMRTMLGSLHQVHLGLASRDTGVILQGAAASGLAAAADPELESLLPPEFLRLAVEVHTGFDSLAAAVRRGETTDAILVQLARITVGCTTCHSQYRLTLDQQARAP